MDVLLDEGLEDWGEVIVFPIVEGVQAAFARELPFLVPERGDGFEVWVHLGEFVAEDPGAAGARVCHDG